MQYKLRQTAEMEKAEGPEVHEAEELSLPPRKSVHRTEKEKWLRIFYRSLLWLFILLVAGLLVWGWRRVRGEM